MKKDKKVQEDMIAPMDSPSFELSNVSSPGSDFQHPGMMPQPNMDKMSLAGPGSKPTKSKKKTKKKEESKEGITNKVLTFQEFINTKLS